MKELIKIDGELMKYATLLEVDVVYVARLLL